MVKVRLHIMIVGTKESGKMGNSMVKVLSYFMMVIF